MAFFNKVCRLLALMVVVGMLLAGDNNRLFVHGQCRGDLQSLTNYCAPFVRKGSPAANPSPACCSAVKSTDVRCACQHLTREAEQVVDVGKVVRVAAFCGNPITRGTKCGSYTVP